VLLARARAMRFRLALLDAWPEDASPSASEGELVDLAIHVPAVVAFAPPPHPYEHQPAPIDRALVDAFVAARAQGLLGDVTRNTLRDLGAAACARVTLLGPERAIAYVRERFEGTPGAARRAALHIAAGIAASARDDDPRALALRLLREHLA
jgi:hypothetical protein